MCFSTGLKCCRRNRYTQSDRKHRRECLCFVTDDCCEQQKHDEFSVDEFHRCSSLLYKSPLRLLLAIRTFYRHFNYEGTVACHHPFARELQHYGSVLSIDCFLFRDLETVAVSSPFRGAFARAFTH